MQPHLVSLRVAPAKSYEKEEEQYQEQEEQILKCVIIIWSNSQVNRTSVHQNNDNE